MVTRSLGSVALLSLLAVACLEKPPGLPEPPREPTAVPSRPATTTAPEPEPVRTPTPSAVPVESADGRDPLDGNFTLADATEGLAGSGPLTATIVTSLGTMQCRLFDDKAPVTVANFVGLARGKRPFKSPLDGTWMKKPFYDGTTFHRVIKGFMIQGGDPRGNGTGEPGYVIKDEVWAGATHDRPGLLCMANRGPNTNGAQFFITDAATRQLDSGYTIFGECSPVTVVRAIASVPKNESDKPLSPVTIERIDISR